MSAVPKPHEASLLELVEQLPPEMQREVRDFVEFLVAKQRQERANAKEPSFGWAGALSDLRGRYTPVELQHMATDWVAEAD